MCNPCFQFEFDRLILFIASASSDRTGFKNNEIEIRPGTPFLLRSLIQTCSIVPSDYTATFDQTRFVFFPGSGFPQQSQMKFSHSFSVLKQVAP